MNYMRGYDDWKCEPPPEATEEELLESAADTLRELLEDEQHKFGGDPWSQELNASWEQHVEKVAIYLAAADNLNPDKLFEMVYHEWVRP